MLGCVIGDVQIFDSQGLVHRHVFLVHGTLYLVQVPALGRVLDEQAAADLCQRVGHIRGNRDTTFHLVDGHVLFHCAERPLAHPEREYGHTQRIEVRLGGEFNVDSVGQRNRVRIDFRCRVDGRAHLQGGASTLLVQDVRYAEVAEHAVPGIAVFDKDIGGLHVLVQHARLVHGVERHCGLEGYSKYGLGITLDAGFGCIAFRNVFREFESLVVGEHIGDIALAL